jgi:hypothetical protein
MIPHEPDSQSGVLPLQGARGQTENDAGWSADLTMSGSAFSESGFLTASTSNSGQSSGLPPVEPAGTSKPLPWKRLLLLALVVLVLGSGLVFALANTTLHAPGQAALSTPGPRQATPVPKQRATPRPTQAAQGFDWVPQRLPTGWTAAGLTGADAIEALRTAITFTDREMSLDFRNAGTAAQPAGTFTAATFLLTPAARQRFNQNDVRVASPALFNSVQQRQLIQEVINGQPALVQFQVQGQQEFAWVTVSFQLFQSQLGNNGQRVESKEVTVMGQPVTHHMGVLLLRVAPAQQGANAPMGGTGWLVSNYTLDGPTLPAIVRPA